MSDKMSKTERHPKYDNYTFEEKLALLRDYRTHPEFRRFHEAYVIYHPLVDRETPESIDALFEVLMWRLSLTDEDDHYSIPTY